MRNAWRPCNADREVLSGANAEILQTIGEELAQCRRDIDALLGRIKPRLTAVRVGSIRTFCASLVGDSTSVIINRETVRFGVHWVGWDCFN